MLKNQSTNLKVAKNDLLLNIRQKSLKIYNFCHSANYLLIINAFAMQKYSSDL